MSFSFTTSAIRRAIVTRMRYLSTDHEDDSSEGDNGDCTPQLHVNSLIALVLLLHVLEHKVERLSLS